MINLCTAAAPCLPGWTHQRRYYRPALFYCLSAAVAYCAAFMSEIGRSIHCRNVAARDSGEKRTRPCRHHRHVAGRADRGKAEHRGRRAATRRIGLNVMPQRWRRQYDQLKRPATGRWRTNKRQRVDAKQPLAAARTEPG